MKSIYRADIDGLRAVAIVPIVLLHFGLHAFAGGYVGVDVFFVISGYLITTNILCDISGKGFSLSNFYMRRLRRIGPALLTVLLLSIAGGYFFLPPSDLVDLSESVGAALLSVSNILFWLETGYFDTSSIYKPLLHTWSLGVEEQFYLIWPLVIFLVATKVSPRKQIWLVGILGIISLIAAQIMLGYDQAGAFYLMPFRVVEFVCGAVLALCSKQGLLKGSNSSVSIMGFLMIIGAVLFYDETVSFPGVTALVPCLGTALIIQSGPYALVNRVLSVRPVVFIGRISYSLYLVHWPLVSFYTYKFGFPSHYLEILSLIASSILLAILLFYFVETPCRQKAGKDFSISNKVIRRASGGAAVVLVALSLSVGETRGWKWRISEELRIADSAIAEARNLREISIRRNTCHYFSIDNQETYFSDFETCHALETENNIVFFGDSHAADVWVSAHLAEPSMNFVQLTGAGCNLPKIRNKQDTCSQFLKQAVEWLNENAERISVVVYTQRAAKLMKVEPNSGIPLGPDPELEKVLFEELSVLKERGLPIFFWGPRAELHPDIRVRLGRHTSFEALQRELASVDYSIYRALDQRLAEASSEAGIPYYSSYEAFCTGVSCPVLNDQGLPLIVDYGHWSPLTSVQYWNAMLNKYDELEGALYGK